MRIAVISLLSLGAVTAPAVTAPAVAVAGSYEREPTEVRLELEAQDYADPVAMKALYGRLRAGAVKACDSGMGRNLTVWVADRDCAREALDKVVRQVGKPVLATIHAEATGYAAPAPATAAAVAR